jgi:hypothetical protein
MGAKEVFKKSCSRLLRQNRLSLKLFLRGLTSNFRPKTTNRDWIRAAYWKSQFFQSWFRNNPFTINLGPDFSICVETFMMFRIKSLSKSLDKCWLASTILIALKSLNSLDLNLNLRKELTERVSVTKILIDNVQNRVGTFEKKKSTF